MGVGWVEAPAEHLVPLNALESLAGAGSTSNMSSLVANSLLGGETDAKASTVLNSLLSLELTGSSLFLTALAPEATRN